MRRGMMEVFLSFQMKSFEGTMVSEMTMVNDNTHSTSRLQPHLMPTQHTPVTSQHSQSQQQQQRQTRHLPPTPSNHVRRQLSSPQVLCKVFVSGIGWGSQVCVDNVLIKVHMYCVTSAKRTCFRLFSAVKWRGSRAVLGFVVASHSSIANGCRV